MVWFPSILGQGDLQRFFQGEFDANLICVHFFAMALPWYNRLRWFVNGMSMVGPMPLGISYVLHTCPSQITMAYDTLRILYQ